MKAGIAFGPFIPFRREETVLCTEQPAILPAQTLTQKATQSMLINESSLHSMFAGFKTAFQQGFDGAKSHLETIAMRVTSSTAEENYGWLGTFPSFREWVGPRVINNLSAHTYALKNKTFESTISVDREHVEDDRVGIYVPMFQEMGRSARMHPDELVFGLLKAGFGIKCYDGQNFFDTDHPVTQNGVEASVTNTDGGSGAPWFLLDTTRAVKPIIWQLRRPYTLVRKDNPGDDNVFFNKEFVYGTDARANAGFGLWQLAWGSKQTLDSAHYAAARAGMMSHKDDAGRPLGVTPTVLIVPPSLESAGRKLLNSELGSGGESNEWKGTAELIVTPYLA
jgi:phage major head subunit gpT-like protein